MNHFMAGFADELTKEAGLITGAGKAVLGAGKRLVTKSKAGGGREFAPGRAMTALMVAPILAGTAIAAKGGYESGLQGGERGRYLQATRDNPGEAAFTNYHRYFKHKASPKAIERMSEFHSPGRFSSYGSRPKTKQNKG